MFLSPFRLISLLLASVVIGLPLAAGAYFFLAVTGSPGTCEREGQAIPTDPALAASFQQKWDQLQNALDTGEVSTVVFSEGEATARARQWVEEHDAPVEDLILCFRPDGGAASGTVSVPFLPADVDVLVEATVDLRGEQPVVKVESIEMGRLPGPLAGFAESLIDNLIEDQTEIVTLSHDYGVDFGEGEVTISGQP
jgi:hypothetical protein